jgi:hypothetical protein
VAGRDFLSIAAGARFRLFRSTYLGVAAEFPLFGNKDLFDFRLTVDFAWRY